METIMNDALLREIRERIGAENVRENELMKLHSSMKTGGRARYFLTPEKAEDCGFLMKTLTDAGVPFYIIGNATNILFRDEGYEGALIQILERRNRIETEGNIICAQAGVMLKQLAARACAEGLTGLEFASGIPGSLGGAVTMNAGAYDGEMKDVIRQVKAAGRDGKIRTFEASECDFSYRHSIFSNGEYIVLEAVMELAPGDSAAIQAKMDDLNARRRQKQPLEYPSCGSVFKRPEGYFAGKLIMDSGLAGARVGGVCVSPKHCGFIVNDQGGTTQDVLDLIAHVQDTVYSRFNVRLECEVKVL